MDRAFELGWFGVWGEEEKVVILRREYGFVKVLV